MICAVGHSLLRTAVLAILVSTLLGCGGNDYAQNTIPVDPEYASDERDGTRLESENDADGLIEGNARRSNDVSNDNPNDSDGDADDVINPVAPINSNPSVGGIVPQPNLPPSRPTGLWKALLFTGDDSINAFDNARRTLANQFVQRGVNPANIAQLSAMSSQLGGGVLQTTKGNIQGSLARLQVGQGDGCIVHMTSHGSQSGFAMPSGGPLSPSEIDSMLNQTCGNRPTVLLVSACYSGVFINAQTSRPNRVILTAARSDRTSFGCGSENQYTYWDGCLIENLPQAGTWEQLYQNVTSCIRRKEAGNYTPSEPQAFFGSQVRNMPVAGAMPY